MTNPHIAAIGFAFATSSHADELNGGKECWIVTTHPKEWVAPNDLFGPFKTIGEANVVVEGLIRTGDFTRGDYCKGRSDLGLS